MKEPAPANNDWDSTDVGVVAVPGRVEVGAGDQLVVVGSGADIWDVADSFHFVYTGVDGDVDVRARVAVTEFEDPWAKAGVMVRGGLGAGAAHAFMGVTPAGALEFIFRAADDGASDSSVRLEGDYSGWVRIVRSGGRLEGFTSSDGFSWEPFAAAEVALGDSARVGVAVTSRNAGSIAEAVVRGLTIASTTPETAPVTEAPVGNWICPSEGEPLAPQYSPTYFVALDGSDSNDGRSEARPFRTLQHAARVVAPGDVVWVRGGVYTDKVDFERSGTAAAPIVFESYPGECAIIDGASLSNGRPVTFWSVQHMVFRNFVVRNSPREGITLTDSHDNRISNVHTYGHFWSGIQLSNSSRNTLSYFITHDNFDQPNGGDADGISVSSGNGNRIEHCIAYNNSDDGIDAWRSTNTVIDSCISYDNGWQGGDGNGFKAGGGASSGSTLVVNSVAFDNKANGFDVNEGRDVRFLNNTAVNNGRFNFVANQSTVLNNNLSYGAEVFVDGANHTHNSWNLRISNPMFLSLDPKSTDFLRLDPASPAIGVGIDVGLPFSGSAPDLGAIQHPLSYMQVLGGPLP